jgi:hypothetical protein
MSLCMVVAEVLVLLTGKQSGAPSTLRDMVGRD